MNCPKCNAVLMVAGFVRCATGDCMKFNCVRCPATFFFDAALRNTGAVAERAGPRPCLAVCHKRPTGLAYPARNYL